MLFRDVIGLVRPMRSGAVYLVFLKITYYRIQAIINEYGGKLISNEDFVVSLLEFYELLCFTSLEKMNRESHSYYYSVLNDTLKLLTSLGRFSLTLPVSECNLQIKTFPYEGLIQFFKKKHKLTSKFISIAYNILKNKNLNFGVFHYFGDRNFVNFLEQIFGFIFIIVPVLEVKGV